jgi:DNA ligase 1
MSNGQKQWVQTFSRNLENTTAMYPELTHIAKQIEADEVILDSEAIGYDVKTNRLIPFQETMTRKRKHEIEHVSNAIPLRFFVFDILYKNGKDLMGEPLSKRRRILEETIKKGDTLVVSPNIVTSDVEKLRRYHDEQLKRGLEGAVVKKWDSPYEPGRKGFHWVKFKEEEGKTGKLTDTVDCVVMGYNRGEGKRAGFGIGAFLVGIKHGEEFVTITKIGTGVSDELWKKLKTAFSRESSTIRPKEYKEVNKALEPDYWITPSIVVEVAADDITVSPIHGAGYALRFPRLVRIREDKSPQNVTTVAEIETMYKNQKSIKK